MYNPYRLVSIRAMVAIPPHQEFLEPPLRLTRISAEITDVKRVVVVVVVITNYLAKPSSTEH